MNREHHQPWIFSIWIDGMFILSPPFFSLLLVILFPSYFNETAEVTTFSWLVLVVLIDVAHVYSTLYRTYLDVDAFRIQRSLFLYIPLFSWIAGVMLYSLGGMVFWRTLAYLAVFHFIRQQYGFLRIYSRKENASPLFKRIDSTAIYTATLYPMLFWHLSPNRAFSWFVKGDFFHYQSEWLLELLTYLYYLILIFYIAKEIVLVRQTRFLNVPRNMIMAGTFVSWYLGIVYFNGDLLFTLFNVVSHGIPYMALIWIYGRKKYRSPKEYTNKFLKMVFSNTGIALFVLVIVGLAFIEEGMWDAMVWREHRSIFAYFSFIPQVKDHTLLSFIVPLLALPQITHYVLDGFIWKINKDKFNWKEKTLS